MSNKDLNRIQQLINEKKSREQAALKLFRPMPHQEPFFKSTALKRVVRGGNRCLGAEQEIYDPVAGKSTPVSEITSEFHVESLDPRTGRKVISRAGVPFVKGVEDLYRIHLSNGESFVCSMNHTILTDGETGWLPVAVCEWSTTVGHIIPLVSGSGTSFGEFPKDVPPWIEKIQDWKAGYWTCINQYRGQIQGEPARENSHTTPDLYVTSSQYIRTDSVYDFKVEVNDNYILAGVCHHNSGKSTCAAVEFASAATRIPIKDSHDNEIPYKYPTDRPLIMWVIGYDLDHLSRNIYRLLFQEGAFKLIRDLKTLELRPWRPWEEDDQRRAKETVPAPPLIPERFVEDWAWENKAQRVFKVCRLVNGTEIRAFSSMGKEPQGDQCDLVWIDEDVENEKLIVESVMRLLDRGGKMFWSAFPKSKNEALRRMSKEAEETDPLAPTCTEVILRMSSNPFLNQQAVQDAMAGMSDEERRSRDFGEFCDDLVAMFPTFDPRLHGIKRNENEQDEIDKVILSSALEPPANWTRYLILDPGHVRPAVLFMAVPPPEFDPKREPTILLYDEIATPRIDAAETARLVEEKSAGQNFEAFIIDGHAGRQTSMGRGETIQQLYSMEFERRGLRSRTTGSSFIQGSDNVEAGLNFIRQYLHINADGRSRIRVVAEKVPNLCKQMESYRKTITSNIVQDKPAPNQVDDLVHCLRYGAAFNPQYRRPEKSQKQYSPAYRSFLSFFKKKKPANEVQCGPQYS